MKKSLKVSVSIFCVCVMLFSLSTPVLASTIHSSPDIYLSPSISVDVNDSQLIQMMEDMGLNDSDISYLMELEHERRENSFSNSLLTGFPTNPYIGQRHTETYRIHFSTVAMSIPGVVGALTKGGVPLALALVFAAGVLNEWQENQDARGVQVSIQYVYGQTNDGLLGWNMGPQSWALFY